MSSVQSLRCISLYQCLGFTGGTVVKNPLASVGDIRAMGVSPQSGRPLGVGNVNPPQYSCLENSMDRGVWQATFPRSQRVRHS